MKDGIKKTLKNKVIIVDTHVHISFKAFCAARPRFVQDVANEALIEKMDNEISKESHEENK